MINSMSTAQTATVSEICAPNINRESSSRPFSSKPRRWPPHCAAFWKHGATGFPCQCTSSIAFGSNGAIFQAKIATKTIMSKMTAPAIASLCFLKRLQTVTLL